MCNIFELFLTYRCCLHYSQQMLLSYLQTAWPLERQKYGKALEKPGVSLVASGNTVFHPTSQVIFLQVRRQLEDKHYYQKEITAPQSLPGKS